VNDLLLRADALPGLLDGWVGPVDAGVSTRCLWDGDTARGYADLVPYRGRRLSLDLSLPECRDRVARVLARVVGLECESTAPAWALTVMRRDRVPHWLLGRATGPYVIFAHIRNEPAWLGVPSLSTLDPSDPTLLPDGSRVVDARALLLVAEHVGRKG
jgi:hypothetical protein